MRWKLVVLVLGLAVTPPPLIVSTQPPAPTDTTPVTLVLYFECGSLCVQYGSSFTRDGFNIDVPYVLSGVPCPPVCVQQTFTYELGLLPAGTYSVRSVFGGAAPVRGGDQVLGSFIVGETNGVAVPALGGWGGRPGAFPGGASAAPLARCRARDRCAVLQ